VRIGVIRTVSSTGAVITSAGLIFAASMFGLTVASITTLVQIGFVIGAGILLDTFLVRTITVPAVATLLGQANWWPSRLAPRVSAVKRIKRALKTRQFGAAAELIASAAPHITASPGGDSAQQSDEDLPHHALPLFGPHGAPRQTAMDGPEIAPVITNGRSAPPATNGAKAAPVAQMPIDGGHPAEKGNADLAETNGRHAAQTNGEHPAQTNGEHPAQTNGRHAAQTNGEHAAETNEHESGKTPLVDPSPKDDRVNGPPWIGCWPASDATFPVGAHDGHHSAATPPLPCIPRPIESADVS
jgi:RND superfamily putative drug exporter